tara:strand:- start:543 stop:1349 length:807 start_codon:yes stop_codon:yes gene_type:complete
MKNFILLFIFALFSELAFSHDDNEERIKFWKEYYNPKVEVTSRNVPDIDISLIKNKPFYQIKTDIKNFKFTPEKNMANNLASEGYGKLFINGEYVSRIYSQYHFLKILPVGINEIKVILSSNLDHDIAVDGKVISDTISYQFPEYTFSEARNKSYNQMIQCEFSDKGQALLKKLKSKKMLITESSDHLQCRYDARNDVLGPFTDKMTRLQRHYHKVTLDALQQRIAVWKLYESNKLSLKDARAQNQDIEDSIDILMQQKLDQLESAKK